MSFRMNAFFPILLFSLTFLVPNGVFPQTEAAAKSTVNGFYKFHRKRSGLISVHELNLRKRWFSIELIRLFRREIKREDDFVKKNPDEKPYFGDGFPFQPFEECVVNDRIIWNEMVIGTAKIKDGKAFVEVRFFIPKECEDQVSEGLLDSYEVELVKGKKRWLINDWIYSDGQRLSDVLKRDEY